MQRTERKLGSGQSFPTGTSANRDEQLRSYFRTLYHAWGYQHWWPAQSRFEVIVGAYLTQNTSWTNVERALGSLRQARVLSVRGIRRTPQPKLERLIRSAGYFRQKTQRLKTFVRFLDNRYAGSLSRMFAEPTAKLREVLLALNGVGPETADSILLYAGNHPAFVVDAYTRRILERHHLMAADAGYEEIRELFERALQPMVDEFPQPAIIFSETADGTTLSGIASATIASAMTAGPRGSSHPPSRMSTAKRDTLVQIFNEMHGLIVGVGKNYCKKSQPECERCPLQKFLPGAE